ncbi:MAG: hypothetical protein WCF90_06050 [Methanomicrobiales archaeon]
MAEFQALVQSINIMVMSLITALGNVQDEKAFQQEVINHLPWAVCVKNSDTGKYIFWNTPSERIFNRIASDIIEKTAREIYSESTASIVKTEDYAALVEGIFAYHKKISS